MAKLCKHIKPYIWPVWQNARATPFVRIEDIAGNILITGSSQIYNSEWAAKLKNTITDTGKAMTGSKVIAFSGALETGVLRWYRNDAGKPDRQ